MSGRSMAGPSAPSTRRRRVRVELRHIEHKAITNVVALEPFECVVDLRYRKHLDIRYDCLLGAEADFFLVQVATEEKSVDQITVR
jgi:hypothetical protein